MKYKNASFTPQKEILANDHFVAVPYDCSSLTADSDGVVKAGTIVPKNDGTAIGVLLYDVTPDDNPNGAVVIHGFVKKSKLPEQPSEDTATGDTKSVGAVTALKQITFLD